MYFALIIINNNYNFYGFDLFIIYYSLPHVFLQASVQHTLRRKRAVETEMKITQGNCFYIVELCQMLSWLLFAMKSGQYWP